MSVLLEINLKSIPVNKDATLFDLASGAGIRVPTSCHRQGKCRECLVEVVEGMEHLSPRVEEEKHLQDKFRLSCCTRIVSDDGIVRCHTLRRGQVRILDEAFGLPVTGNPMELRPAVTRDGDRILLDGEPIAVSTKPIHGLSLDLGTTTVTVRLMNLETGQLEAVQSFENPQRFGGSNVMARIKYDTDHKGRLLQRVLLGYLAHAIEAFPVDPTTIYEMVVAGNATMRDLLFGLNVYSIGQKPFRSITEQETLDGKRECTSINTTANKLRLPLHPDARVYGLPLIGCHVGADTAACLLAIRLAEEDRNVALMDIGTNTELVVGNKDKISAASCPAGPAFEGGEIVCGMPALDGAIERVAIGADGRVDCKTIGDDPPQGICGSGLIDLLSELLRTGGINDIGRFQHGEDRFLLSDENRVYLLENDISLLAQAKGAHVAGLYTTFAEHGIDFEDVEVFYLAGGFAGQIDIEAAKRIGLIPNLPSEKIIKVGNASLEGATMALCSTRQRRVLEQFVKRIEHIPLEQSPDFFEHFVMGCQFLPVTTDNSARGN